MSTSEAETRIRWDALANRLSEATAQEVTVSSSPIRHIALLPSDHAINIVDRWGPSWHGWQVSLHERRRSRVHAGHMTEVLFVWPASPDIHTVVAQVQAAFVMARRQPGARP